MVPAVTDVHESHPAFQDVAVVKDPITELGSQRVDDVGEEKHEGGVAFLVGHLAVGQLPLNAACAVGVVDL